MAQYGSDSDNPNYIESVASLKRKTKEDIRLDSIIPEGILENSDNPDGDPNVKGLSWGNKERIMCISIWPIAVLVFFLSFFKTYFD